MAAVSVTAQNTRLDDAETTTNWVSVGGGGAGALETDFFFQGSNSYARKGATGQRTIGLSDNVNSDLSGTGTYETVMFKYVCTTPGLLDLLSVPGQRLEIGSGSTANQSSNRYNYDVQGSDTYPIDKSWLVLPINPNVAAHRTSTTGTPDLTACDWYGLTYDQTGTSKSPNQALDAVDIGAGLTLVGGDGGDADGVFQDFSDADWGSPTAGRFGYVRENESGFVVFGMLVIGSATATAFTDSNKSIVFPDGLFAAGFSGITVDLQNASTTVDTASLTVSGRGDATGEDTRPVLIVTGTAGAWNAVGDVWNDLASITLTSGYTQSGGVLWASDITQGGADLSDLTIKTDAVTSVATLTDPDFAKLSGIVFEQVGAGHAMEIDTAGTYTFNNLTGLDVADGGYGANTTDDAAIDVTATTGTVTIQLTNGSTTPTYKTAGATVVIEASVTLTIDGTPTGSAITIAEAADQTVHFDEAPTTGTSTDFSYNAATLGGTVVDIIVIDIGEKPFQILGYTLPSVSTTIPIALATDPVFSDPP